MASKYWKGAIGRAHDAMAKSALQQTASSQLARSHVYVQRGHERQTRLKQQHQNRKLASNWRGQINMLSAHIQDTDLSHRWG